MKTVIEMAREIWSAGNVYIGPSEKRLAQFAELVRADEREKVAAWMMQQGYATGHGDTIKDLLQELERQINGNEREE